MAKETFLSWLLAFFTLSVLVFYVTAVCDFPEEIPYGKLRYERKSDVNLTEAEEYYNLRFICRRGFMLQGPKLSVCMKGMWMPPPPECIRIRCPKPPVIANGAYIVRRGVNYESYLGTEVIYSCNENYQMVEGDEVLKCGMSKNIARWIGNLPNCTEKDRCLDPGVSPTGSRKGDCCFSGDTLRFECHNDTQLVGQKEIRCLPGGKWSSPRPRCEPIDFHCDDPPVIANGKVTWKPSSKSTDYFVPYEQVSVECNPGYSTSGGSDFLYCDDIGWDDEFASCEASFCTLPPILSNGTIIELESTNATSFPYQFEITYECDPGFRLIGNSWRICESLGWSGQSPYCEAIQCPNPGNPENGRKLGDSFELGEKVIFECDAGYTLIGSAERYCLPNGQWSGELARCDNGRNYCYNPGTPINGIKSRNAYYLGDEVEFKCSPGFSLVGSDTRICQEDKTWSGIEARCLGPYDFDTKEEVSQRLRHTLHDKITEQKKETENYVKSQFEIATFNRSNFNLEEAMDALNRQRVINLNYPGRLIFYFIFDSSGSVGKNNFRISIDFAKALVQKVKVKPQGARFGALTFSSKATVEFLPVTYDTTEGVLNALDNLNFTSGGTATSSALKNVLEEMIPLTQNIYGKNNVKSLVFVLTDGKANMGGDPQEQADKLKEAGVEIFCIGITGTVMKDSLYKIASLPHDEHVFILNNYKSFARIIQDIVNGTIDYSQCGLGLERIAAKKRMKRDINRARIIGGDKVIEPWPWMAALYVMDHRVKGSSQTLKCGGSIVGQRWILTAAHCLFEKMGKRRNKLDLIVKLGLVTEENVTSSVEAFGVDEFDIHESYNPLTLDYDIALLKLSRNIEFNAFVTPICLPPADLPEDTSLYKPKEYAFAAGWGYDQKLKENEDAQYTVPHLKELKLKIRSNKTCKDSLKGRKEDKYIFTERMFCVGSGLGEVDTCKGDSGGPLMQSQLSDEGFVYWVQIGIVSWGIGCAQMHTYGFYAHVHYFLNWIQERISAI